MKKLTLLCASLLMLSSVATVEAWRNRGGSCSSCKAPCSTCNRGSCKKGSCDVGCEAPCSYEVEEEVEYVEEKKPAKKAKKSSSKKAMMVEDAE